MSEAKKDDPLKLKAQIESIDKITTLLSNVAFLFPEEEWRKKEFLYKTMNKLIRMQKKLEERKTKAEMVKNGNE